MAQNLHSHKISRLFSFWPKQNFICFSLNSDHCSVFRQQNYYHKQTTLSLAYLSSNFNQGSFLFLRTKFQVIQSCCCPIRIFFSFFGQYQNLNRVTNDQIFRKMEFWWDIELHQKLQIPKGRLSRFYFSQNNNCLPKY